MASTTCGRYLLGTIFLVICLVIPPVLLTNAENGDIAKPTFTYVEPRLLKITYAKGVNRSLYLCCNSSGDDPVLILAVCGHMPLCPKYKNLSSCKTRGKQVCCEVDPVQSRVKMQGYVGWFDGKKSVPLSDIATYVTDDFKKKPHSVSGVNVNRNLQQGLDIHWKPLNRFQYSFIHRDSYQYCVRCKPVGNPRAKAVSKCVKFGNSFLEISSKEVTAVSKYQCCVRVENLRNNQPSEETCQNIMTSEQAPGASPVIFCGNDTVECPSVVKGTKRDITILFKPPSPKQQNGIITHHEVFYRNVTTSNSTVGNVTRLIVNGSKTEAVITNADTRLGYHVYMTSCTAIGCSSPSNTIYIPELPKIDTESNIPVLIIALSVAAFVILAVGMMIFVVKRKRQREREEQLPKLSPNDNQYPYEYPNLKGEDNEIYLELASQPSTSSCDDVNLEDLDSRVTVVCNPVTLAAENV